MKEYIENVLGVDSTHFVEKYTAENKTIVIGDLIVKDEESITTLATDRYYSVDTFDFTGEELNEIPVL